MTNKLLYTIICIYICIIIYIYYYCLLLLLLLFFISFLFFIFILIIIILTIIVIIRIITTIVIIVTFFLGFRQGTVSTWNRSLGAGFRGSAPAQNLVPAKAAILNALKMGYRGIDTSEMNRTTINYH